MLALASEGYMPQIGSLLIALVLLSPHSVSSQSQNSSSPTVQITGVVQSFSGNTLDVKPATSPAVWIRIPEDLHVDSSALKPGAEVSIEAHWAVVCYVASQVAIRK
jgi:hypothetical protein